MRTHSFSSWPWLTAVLFVVCLVCTAARAADNQPYNRPTDLTQGQAYIIGLGDVIEVQVWKEPDLSRTGTVRLDGKISLPLIGDVVAAGKTPEALARQVKKQYSAIITEPAVSVLLTQSTSRRYYVVGQIQQPGEFAITYPITVLQALARAGGFQEWAKKASITIIRRQEGREQILPFNYEDVIAGKGLNQNILIAPGDTIIVP